jgi:hypothetical protein
MSAGWWIPISALLAAGAGVIGKKVAQWFLLALRRSMVDAVTEITMPLVAEMRTWAETAIVHRLDDHEVRIKLLEEQ